MLGIPWGTEEQHIWVKTTDLFSKINRTWTEIYQSTIKYFHNFFAQRILSDLIEKTSLRPALMSRKWWTRLLLVRDTVWSRALCRFFVMNAGISKRNNNLAEFRMEHYQQTDMGGRMPTMHDWSRHGNRNRTSSRTWTFI